MKLNVRGNAVQDLTYFLRNKKITAQIDKKNDRESVINFKNEDDYNQTKEFYDAWVRCDDF